MSRLTFFKNSCFILFLLVGVTTSWAQPTEIIFWHSHAGHHGQEVAEMANAFNRSQSQFTVRPVYKGNYIECLTSLAAAFRAGLAPPLVQVFEVGTQAMLVPKGIIKPVEALMKKYEVSLPKEGFFPTVRQYFSENNQMVAMPFNTSIPVMFYNADALKKLGYGQHNFPKTWDELEILAEKLKKAGYPCAYSTANPAWILIESISAMHGLPVINDAQSQALYNNVGLIQFLTRLKSWQDKNYFEYGGRTDDSTILFTSGRCPLYSQSSGAYNSLAKMVSFQIAVAPIPLDTNLSTKRYSNVSGGGALWVMAGHNDSVYQGAAQFIAFLSRPEIQLRWHQQTGYLPLGVKGNYQSMGLESTHPSLNLAKKELSGKKPKHLEGLSRVHNQIRMINEESLEALFAGIKSPKEAMDFAVKRSNHALSRFRQNTKT